MSISVVMATYNEERNLPNSLKCVNNWCDEIVIVDGSSSDNTVAIARRYKARVITVENPPIFHINKQKAIDLAKFEWILQLDADEEISDTLKNEIKQATKNPKYNGYWIPRKNFFLGRFLMKGGVYPDYTLRLYRRGYGRLPQQSVHEQAIVSGKVGYLTNPIIHMADTTLRRYLLRFNRYTNLIAEELRKNHQSRSVLAFFSYLVFKPISWFLTTYIRHKGFMDSWQGFVFSFFSSLRFPISYIKYLKKV